MAAQSARVALRIVNDCLSGLGKGIPSSRAAKPQYLSLRSSDPCESHYALSVKVIAEEWHDGLSRVVAALIVYSIRE
jgi:hypothetical protein